MDTQRKGLIKEVIGLLCHSCKKTFTNFLQIQVNISFQSMLSNPPVRGSLLMQWFRSWNSECALNLVIIRAPRLVCTLQPSLELRNFKMTGMEWIYVCVYVMVVYREFCRAEETTCRIFWNLFKNLSRLLPCFILLEEPADQRRTSLMLGLSTKLHSAPKTLNAKIAGRSLWSASFSA